MKKNVACSSGYFMTGSLLVPLNNHQSVTGLEGIMGNLSHSKEVEESISKEKSADTVVSVETDSEVCVSLNEPIIAEKSKESCGENEETEGQRIYELEVRKAASKESSQKIDESISTGGYALASECINNAETTISEPSGIVNETDVVAKGMNDVNGENKGERIMGNLSHSKEVEESISKEKSADTVVSVETNSEVCVSLNEPIIAEKLKESCGENEETEGRRIYELEVKKAASKESSQKIDESINTGGYYALASDNAETTISEPSGIVSGENKEERNLVAESLDLSLPSPNEERLFKVNEAVAAKGRKYREAISSLQAKRESLKLDYSVLAKELVVAKDEEQGLYKIVQGIKGNASTLNSRLDAQNKSQQEHAKAVLTLKSLHEKISRTDGHLIQLKNENISLRKQVIASQMELEHHWDTFKKEKSKKLEEIENQKRKIQGEKAELERLEGRKMQNRDQYEKAQEASEKKDLEMKFVEKKYAGVRSLYNGDIRDLTEGHAVMKAYVEDAKGKFDKKMDSLEVFLQAP